MITHISNRKLSHKILYTSYSVIVSISIAIVITIISTLSTDNITSSRHCWACESGENPLPSSKYDTERIYSYNLLTIVLHMFAHSASLREIFCTYECTDCWLCLIPSSAISQRQM